MPTVSRPSVRRANRAAMPGGMPKAGAWSSTSLRLTTVWSDIRQRLHQLLDRIRGLRQLGALVVLEVDLHDLLDPLGAELHRHAHEQAVDPELALAQSRARQHALLVVDDRVDHLGYRGRGGVERRALLQQLDHLGAAVARAL